nr:MAG TPA: hypothetical protein [Caudoviricetes sp.]
MGGEIHPFVIYKNIKYLLTYIYFYIIIYYIIERSIVLNG